MAKLIGFQQCEKRIDYLYAQIWKLVNARFVEHEREMFYELLAEYVEQNITAEKYCNY